MAKEIAYQNKDIVFKILSETYKEKSFQAYGLDLPKIVDVLPTNLPDVAANELRMDNLFLLEDGSFALVDYESEDKPKNILKYLNYVARVMEKYYEEEKRFINLRLVIIYTGDVEKAENVLENHCLTLRMEQVFLSRLDSESLYQKIKNKIDNRESLTEEELMQLIILPITEKGKEEKRNRIRQVIEMAQRMDEEQEQAFLLANLLVISDKFIDESESHELRRWLNMTKVARLIAKDNSIEIAKKMIMKGIEDSVIIDCTNLTFEEVEAIKEEMLAIIRKSKKED